jgi:hypothetical protein
MKDYLTNSKKAFESLQLRNIMHLLSVVRETRLTTKPLVKKRYTEQATDFDATLSFLIEIGGLIEDDDKLKINHVLADQSKQMNVKEITAHIFERILMKKSAYRTELFSYFNQFKLVNGHIEYQPNTLQRTKFSNIRNFLMESGVINYNADSVQYVVAPQYINIYAKAIEADSSYTPYKLKQKLQNADKVGLAAEKAVLKYEKERVGPDLEKYIEHISIKNVSAGYDIKSVTQIGSNELDPRYIEVKAVSPTLYKFFWTSNEMRVAEILRKNYYLYLLPVAGHLSFSLFDIKIIPDPFSEIILSSNSWDIETNVVCCTLTSE